jgi:hypothetical protein
MSSNNVDSKFLLESDYNKPEDYLTEREKKIIEKTNKLAYDANNPRVIDFFHLSLTDLLKNWSNNMQAIMIDLTETLYVNEYIQKTDNIYQFIVVFAYKLWEIFTKEFRIIYFGMTLVFISILIYFVNISG